MLNSAGLRLSVQSGGISEVRCLGENGLMVDGVLGASNFLLMFKPSPEVGHIVPDRVEGQLGAEGVRGNLGVLDILKDAVEVIFPICIQRGR